MMAKTGSNTPKVADINGAGKETLHVSHLKPYLPEQGGGDHEDEDDARPPRDASENPATIDRSSAGGAPHYVLFANYL